MCTQLQVTGKLTWQAAAHTHKQIHQEDDDKYQQHHKLNVFPPHLQPSVSNPHAYQRYIETYSAPQSPTAHPELASALLQARRLVY